MDAFWNGNTSFRKIIFGAEHIAQWLGALSTLPEEPNLAPSTHNGQVTTRT